MDSVRRGSQFVAGKREGRARVARVGEGRVAATLAPFPPRRAHNARVARVDRPSSLCQGSRSRRRVAPSRRVRRPTLATLATLASKHLPTIAAPSSPRRADQPFPACSPAIERRPHTDPQPPRPERRQGRFPGAVRSPTQGGAFHFQKPSRAGTCTPPETSAAVIGEPKHESPQNIRRRP